MRQKLVHLVEFRHAVELLERHASPVIVDRGLKAAGIKRAMLTASSGFLPYTAEAVLIEFVARTIGDQHLGARLGRDFDYSTYGAYANFVLGAPNLETALDRGRRALMLTHPGSQIESYKTDHHLVVGRYSKGLTAVGYRHLDEGAVFVIGHVVRHFLGPDWRPDWVDLPNASEDEITELEKLFDAPIRTDAKMPAVAIRFSDLSTLNPDSSTLEKPITLNELGALMGVAPVQTMEDAVTQILKVTFAAGDLSVDTVARLLAVGPRTLQRALKKEKTSFREVRSRFVERQMLFLLSETDTPIGVIAKRLGYTEPRSFRRACKAWTGLSPSEFRSRHL